MVRKATPLGEDAHVSMKSSALTLLDPSRWPRMSTVSHRRTGNPSRLFIFQVGGESLASLWLSSGETRVGTSVMLGRLLGPSPVTIGTTQVHLIQRQSFLWWKQLPEGCSLDLVTAVFGASRRAGQGTYGCTCETASVLVQIFAMNSFRSKKSSTNAPGSQG